MVNFICPMVKNGTDRAILWQRGHYSYQLGDGPLLSGSLEEVQEDLARLGWAPARELRHAY